MWEWCVTFWRMMTAFRLLFVMVTKAAMSSFRSWLFDCCCQSKDHELGRKIELTHRTRWALRNSLQERRSQSKDTPRTHMLRCQQFHYMVCIRCFGVGYGQTMNSKSYLTAPRWSVGPTVIRGVSKTTASTAWQAGVIAHVFEKPPLFERLNTPVPSHTMW